MTGQGTCAANSGRHSAVVAALCLSGMQGMALQAALTGEAAPRRSATLRQEEASGQIMGLLLGLDAVRFLLLVDAPQGSPRVPGGLMGGLRQYLPQPWARQGHPDDGADSAQPHQAKPAPVTATPMACCSLFSIRIRVNVSHQALARA